MALTRKPKSETNEGEAPAVYRWKVVGGSPFHGGNHRIYKPGEVFDATESEIPAAFRDVIQKVDVTPIQHTPIAGIVPVYELKEHPKTDPEDADEEQLWDIVNQKGKLINEKPQTKEKAEAFLKRLSE